MTIEQTILLLQLVQLVGGAVWLGRFLWRIERRIYRIELELNIDDVQPQEA